MEKTKIKVLLIDDEREFVSLLAKRLEIRGYRCKIAEDSQLGLHLLENEKFDVAVIDLMMPGIRGVNLLERIKKIDQNIPVIFLSGHGGGWKSEEDRIGDEFDFLAKPVGIEVLIERINLVTSLPD